MTTVLKRCRGEKKRGERKIDRFRKKSIIPESEILTCPNTKSNQKQVVNEKIPEEYSVKIYEIDPFFQEHYKKNTS